MSSQTKPTGITLNQKERYLEISWSDGRTCQYPLSQLREACPCVECRGGHQYMGLRYAPDNILTLTPSRSYNLTNIQQVGNYALQPTWDDGHSTGIYTWEFLYHICPPEETDQA